MNRAEKDKLWEFAQKIRKEGAAGFADGPNPWDSWEQFTGQGRSRVWNSTAQRVDTGKPATRSFGDRILGAMTVLTIATLLIGIAGVYFSRHPGQDAPLAGNNLPLNVTDRTPATYPEPVTRLEPVVEQEAGAATADIELEVLSADIETLSADLDNLSADLEGMFRNMDHQLAPAAGIPAVPDTNRSIDTPVLPAAGEPAETDPSREPLEPIATNTPVQPVPAATQTQQAEPASQAEPPARDGDWVINLASYAQQAVADRMQAEFEDKGVTTEQVAATVRGKTYYRLRVTGFATRQDATAHSSQIREQLGLGELWVTRK